LESPAASGKMCTELLN